MFDFLSIIPSTYASWVDAISMAYTILSTKWVISIMWLFALFVILVTEKLDKTLVSILIAWLLIFLQVFTKWDWILSSQDVASGFIFDNLDIFAFIIGMMIITWIVKDSWVFHYVAVKVVKKLKWSPTKLFFVFSYMAFIMTIFISNIPTIIILAPIIILITSKIDLPTLPYLIWIITFANLWWAVTPISDPTTYYQTTTLWFSFMEVLTNTWLIMLSVTVSSSIYLYFIFRKDFAIIPEKKAIKKLKAKKDLKSKEEIITSVWILFCIILIIVFKEFIFNTTWIKFDNWSVALFWAFIWILFLNYNVSHVLKTKVDYSTLFFFAGLFIVIWALEYNWIIILLADKLIDITWWNDSFLLFMVTMWSGLLSVFIDNVPYNIAMVSTLEQFLEWGVVVWSTWTALAWWLNSCTSIGWAWSPIWSACNVIALWEAEKSWVIVLFFKYLKIWIPLVFINSLISYFILYFRYIG